MGATPPMCWRRAVKRRGPGPALAAQARGWGGRVSQRRAFGAMTKVVANFLSGTVAVSNLGLIQPDWVDSADFDVCEMWFSPPGVGTGLGIGTVSVGDTLHVTIRYSRGVFSRDAAAAFADVLRAEIDLLCHA